jgi:hypothetical protein
MLGRYRRRSMGPSGAIADGNICRRVGREVPVAFRAFFPAPGSLELRPHETMPSKLLHDPLDALDEDALGTNDVDVATATSSSLELEFRIRNAKGRTVRIRDLDANDRGLVAARPAGRGSPGQPEARPQLRQTVTAAAPARALWLQRSSTSAAQRYWRSAAGARGRRAAPTDGDRQLQRLVGRPHSESSVSRS